MITAIPVTLREANDFIASHCRAAALGVFPDLRKYLLEVFRSAQQAGAWRAMGGRRLVTYTLKTECGASLRGAGAEVIAQLPARNAAGWQNRAGRDWQPVVGQAKLRWEWAI